MLTALSLSPAAATADVPFAPTYDLMTTHGLVTPAASNGPMFLSPTELENAYGSNQISFIASGGSAVQGTGAGQTIAIIDAYDDPNIASDLMSFDAYWGLPDPPNFSKVAQDGSGNLPGTDPAGPGVSNWEYEEALDVEYAHASAPDANILLVECNGADFNDLITGVEYAAAQPGVSVVSMSWGGGEFDGEASFDSLFTTPSGHAGVTFVASTGDAGAPGEWPAYSSNVLAVGGTTLVLDSATLAYSSETGWSDGGGGVSAKVAQPAFQSGVVTQSLTQRTTPDVSFDADPNSGVYVYDTYNNSPLTPWEVIGGTSLAAPSWAGLVAIADQGRAVAGLGALDGPSQVLPALYHLPSTDFHDVTAGNNGFAAGVGYDLVTGIGTPVANELVPDLAGLVAISSTPAAGNVVVGAAPTKFSFTFDAPLSSSSLVASGLTVDGVAANSVALTNSTTLTFTFNTSPVTAQGLQTMSLAGGAVTRLSDGAANVAYSATFRYAATQLQVVATTPASGSVVALPMTTLQVQFNEPPQASGLSASNLSVSEGIVTGFTQINATTVDYTLSGVTSEAILTVGIAYGALSDSYGNPIAAYTGTFSLNYPGPVAFPTLASVSPLGALIYGASASGLINFSGNTDQYTLTLDAGQTLSVGVTPDAALEPSVAVSGPGGAIATASSSGAGAATLLQTIPIAATGVYTITISGLDGTSGAFTALATLNSALDTGDYGGATPSTLATAQSLVGGFTSLGNNASRTAVIGQLDATDTTDNWYGVALSAGDTLSLEAADLDGASTISLELWSAAGALLSSAGGTGLEESVTDFTAPTAGTYEIHVFGASALTTYALAVTQNAELDNLANNQISTAQPLDSASENGVQTAVGQVLSSQSVESFESDSLSAYTFTNPSEDGASITTTAAHDGSYGLALASPTEWMYRDDAAAQVGEGDEISVWIRSEASAPTGRAYFGFGASAAGTLSVVMAGNSNQFILQDNTGYGFTDLDDANQIWQGNQWYRIDITWSINGTITANLYAGDGVTLLNTVSANDTSITSGGIAFRSFGTTTDFDSITIVNEPTPTYSLSLGAGSYLDALTATPGDGAGEPDNQLDPELLLYNSAGLLVAADDNSAPDQRNAHLGYFVPADGAGTYYLEVLASPLTAEPTSGDYVLTVAQSAVGLASPSGVGVGVATAGAAKIVDPGLTLDDANPDPSLSATVSLTAAGGYQPGDVLTLPASSLFTSSFSASPAGGVLSISTAQGQTPSAAQLQAALASVTLTSSAAVGTRTISFVVTDGTQASNVVTSQVSVVAPAEVTGIYVMGSGWSTQFLDYLADPPSGSALGSATYGYALQTGYGQLIDLPWTNIDTITVTFSEPVYVNPNQVGLGLFGANQPPTLEYTGPASDVLTSVATWALVSPLTVNGLIFALPAAAVTDTNGAELDGAWTNNSTVSPTPANGSAFPSGDGLAGSGDFDFDFNVLPGDVNQDGYVLGGDATSLRPLLATNTSSPTYSPYYDLVGSGTILGSDATGVRNQLGKSLPAMPTLEDGLESPSLTIGEPGSTNVAPALGTLYLYLAASSGSSADQPSTIAAATIIAQPPLADIAEPPIIVSAISAPPDSRPAPNTVSILGAPIAANTNAVSTAFQANAAQSAAATQSGDSPTRPLGSIHRSLLAETNVLASDAAHAKVSYGSHHAAGAAAQESRARSARLMALDHVLAEADFFEM